MVIKHHRGEQSGKYVNVAVLEGDQIKIVDERASSLPDCPELLTSLLGFDSPASWVDSVNVLVQLAVSMRGARPRRVAAGRAAGQRGMARVDRASRSRTRCPRRFASWRADARNRRRDGQPMSWKEALRETVDAIAGLTAVDGAAIITEQYELLAFGAKIQRRRGAPPVEQVTVTEPIEGGVPHVVNVVTARRHAASVGRAVRARPAQRDCAGRVAGSAIHRVRVVAVRGERSRASRGGTAALRAAQGGPCAARSRQELRATAMKPGRRTADN